ncbi:hypothetical protein V8E52_005296 [Russula decolorans]|jgi:hypothetical protein
MLASSAIIEVIDAMRKAGLALLVFFYCDFREYQKKNLRGLVSSLLVQLRLQSDSYSDIMSNFYSDHAKGSRHLSDGTLAGRLKDLLKLPGLAHVYLIMELIESQLVMHMRRFGICDPNLLICVTSRLESDIKDILDPLIFRFIPWQLTRWSPRQLWRN